MRRILLACGLLFAQVAIGQQTLLWKVTGKGLQTPSYLYGTMHVRDRAVFDFPDSLYTAIENCDQFALELNPDSISGGLGDLLTNYFKDALKNKQTLSSRLSKEQMAQLRKYFNKENKDVDVEDLTVADLTLQRETLLMPKKKDDMPVFMDGWLCSFAKGKGKKILGLEKIEDQLYLLNKLGDMELPKNLVSTLEQEKKSLQTLVDRYKRSDLDGLYELYGKGSTSGIDSMDDLFLNKRNGVMAASMERFMEEGSLFAAVGALHLPGEKGVIARLRAMGYTVTPVISPTRTHASKKVIAESTAWVDFRDDAAGYSILMPGKPSEVDLYNGVAKMQMYVDMTSERYYISTGIALTDGSSPDSLMERMAGYFSASKGKAIKKKVSLNGLEGYEYEIQDEQGASSYINVLTNRRKIYLYGIGGKGITVATKTTFFGSFKAFESKKASSSIIELPGMHIKALLPNLKASLSTEYNEDSTTEHTDYTLVDQEAGLAYFIVRDRAAKGYNFTDDSVWKKLINTNMAKSNITVHFTPSTWRGYPADDFITDPFKSRLIKGRVVYMGNTVYRLFAEYGGGPVQQAKADSFLRSISLVNYQPAPLVPHKIPGTQSTIKLPSAPQTWVTDSASQTIKYLSFDSILSLNYVVSVRTLSPYYWQNEDGDMLKKLLEVYEDSSYKSEYRLLEEQYPNEPRKLTCEALFTNNQTTQINHFKIIPSGNQYYLLNMVYPKKMAHAQQVTDFFHSFTNSKPGNVATTPAKLFKDLHSKDSATFVGAVTSIYKLNFTAKERDMLIKAMTDTYPLDSVYGRYAAVALSLQAEKVTANLPVKNLIDYYQSVSEQKPLVKILMLELIVNNNDSSAAFQALDDLLGNHGRLAYAYLLYDKLAARPVTAARYFPKWLYLVGDTDLRSTICKLAYKLNEAKLIDLASLATNERGRGNVSQILSVSKEIREHKRYDDASDYIDLLFCLKTDAATKEIALYQQMRPNHIRLEAVTCLTELGVKPDARILDSIAADPRYRLKLYWALEADKKLGYFPKRFLNQQSLAEASMYMSYESLSSVKYLAVKPSPSKNYKGKFYLYDVSYGDGKHYLGVAGPYSNEPTNLFPEDDSAFIVDKPLDKTKLDKMLKEFLDE